MVYSTKVEKHKCVENDVHVVFHFYAPSCIIKYSKSPRNWKNQIAILRLLNVNKVAEMNLQILLLRL